MTRWILWTGIVGMGVAAIVVSERQKVDVPASPAALLYLVADTERELTRMPARFTRMSDQEEIRIGDELARSYAHEEEREKSQETLVVERYLTQVGRQLASRAHRQLPYKFHYLASPYLVNAFALPGGHVYVGGGLLSLMDSEDELAAVIGHEIEHIDHYHCAERVQQEEALRKIPLGGLMAIPIEVFEAGYSKDQELEADREGTRLAVQSGYSPNGAIRMFETFDRLYKEYRAKAHTPQEEVSNVALQTVEGYFRSHPLPAERIAQVQRMIASEGWPLRAERDLQVGYIFLTARAGKLLEEHQYPQAEQTASRSLKLQPAQPVAMEVLAEAQFAQANFSAAADTYRKMLGSNASNQVLIDRFAHSLAAADRRAARSIFDQWLGTVNGFKPQSVEIDVAGLALLAGNGQTAREIEVGLKASRDGQAPVMLAELGWWHYLAGDYQVANDLLGEAVQQRPGGQQIWLRLAWSQIEVRRFSDAIHSLDTATYEQHVAPERAIVRAVAEWQAQEPNLALQDFDVALRGKPEWENPAWVKAQYSPLVVQSVQEMQSERERRLKKAKVAANR
jgi:beta-barrel assembly-enhancing protease